MILHSRLKTLFKVFLPVTVCLLLRLISLISCNLTSRCLAVTGGGGVGECGRLSQPSYTLILTYLQTVSTIRTSLTVV